MEQDQSLFDLFQSDQLTGARRRVFRQLFEALVFEQIVRADVREEGGRVRVVVPGAEADGAEVEYVAEGRRRQSFGRLRLEGPVMRLAQGRALEASSLARFLLETRGNHGADADRLTQFIVEVEQTMVKHAQAERHRLSAALPPGDDYDALETACGGGHPYHPAFKSRIGFDLEDNAAFGPEFGPTLRPLWLAARSEHSVAASIPGLDHDRLLAEEVGQANLAAWQARLGPDRRRHVLVPVHPWQWREQILPVFHEDLASGRLIPLGRARDDYRPQQSIRTLANLSSPRRSTLKLSLGMVNTSTARILAPHTVANAPLVSRWLTELAAGDRFLREELRPVFLREVAGAAYDPPQPEPLRARGYGALSCIWRESIHRHLQPGEQAVPWLALTHRGGDGQPLLQHWIGRHGRPWLERLLEVAVTPLLHLLIAHGVGLEAHAQNMVLILRDGLPSRLALKDFHDGVRFSPAHLARPEQAPALHATPGHHVRVNRNSYLTVDDPQAVRDFLFDAFFFINLGELAMFLADRLAIPEDWFWGRVDGVVSAYQRRFPELAGRAALFELRPVSIAVEKLTSRRLFPETDVQVHPVPLPFGRPPSGLT